MHARMRIQCRLDLGTEAAGRARGSAVVRNLAEHLFDTLKCDHREEVAGNVERVYARIIRGTETGVNQTEGPRRIAVPVSTQRVVGRKGLALEVIGSMRGFALLRFKRTENSVHRPHPLCAERFGIVGDAPVFMRQAHGVAERVDFPFSLAHAGFHFGFVGLAPRERLAAGEVGHEGIRVRIGEDASCLAPDDAFDEFRKFRIGGEKRQIGPHLGRGVAQPHRGNVAGDHDGVGTADAVAECDGGVERVRQAVREEPRQFGIAHFRGNGLDGSVDRLAAESARGWSRAFGDEAGLCEGIVRRNCRRADEAGRAGKEVTAGHRVLESIHNSRRIDLSSSLIIRRRWDAWSIVCA